MPSSPLPRTRRSLDFFSFWALLITIGAALVAVVPASIASVAVVKPFVIMVGALVSLALFILARLTRGNVVFPATILLAALWLPVIAYGLSAAFSGVPFAGALWGAAFEADTVGMMLAATVLGTLAALQVRRAEQYQMFFRVGAYIFGAVVLTGIVTVVVGQFTTIVSPAFSLLGTFRDLAAFLGLGVIVILMAFRFLEPKDCTRRSLMAGVVGALFLLAIANVTLVWLLVALVSLGLFVEAIMRRSSSAVDADLEDVTVIDEAFAESDEKNHSPVFPLAVLAISLFFLIGSALGGALASGLHVNLLNVRPSWQSTLSVAKEAYATSPMFGSGPNTFGVEWLRHRDAALNSTVFWNVDFASGIGFIPTAFVTTGLLGVLAWVVFLGLGIVLGLRMLLVRAPQDALTRYMAVVSFVGFVYLAAIALFDLPNVALIALSFVFAGVFASTMRFAANGKQWGIMFSRSPRVGFVIVFLLTILLLSSVAAAYALIGRGIAAVNVTRAATALSAAELDKADSAAQAAISFAPSAMAYRVEVGVANARLAAIVSSSTMDRTQAQQAYQEALSAGINAALTATNLDSNNYQNWLALGNLYAQAVPLGVSGAYESAKTAYQKAQALNPTNPEILYILAQLDISHKDPQAAEANLRAAIALKQDYTNAIFLLSQIEVQNGNVKDALASALAAAYFTPNNPNILFQVGILYAAQGELANAATALSAAVAANPQFANARYFLAAVYAKLGDTASALVQVQAIADMSPDNAAAVATQLAALRAGTNPFPADLLSAPSTPVQQ